MLTVLFPLAGSGQRFAQAGYRDSKPLIDVLGKPMVVRSVESVVAALTGPYNLVFVVRDAHAAGRPITNRLWEEWPGCRIVSAHSPTEGAACTCLLARHLFDNASPLMIANCDQVVHPDAAVALTSLDGSDDARILTMKADGTPKWSYVRVNVNDFVLEVAEKKPISDRATCGLYWWRHGYQFAASAEKMIAANDRTNGEFYVAPTYNHMPNGSTIREVRLEDHGDVFHGLGTPEDLEEYVKSITVRL